MGNPDIILIQESKVLMNPNQQKEVKIEKIKTSKGSKISSSSKTESYKTISKEELTQSQILEID